MAYYRPSLQQAISPSAPRSTILLNEKENENKESDENKIHNKSIDIMKPLIIFSIDMTHWSPAFQYFFLAFFLTLFMCFYGYFQELVVYGWFQRKLSMFSTFLHFLGCSIIAQIQRNLSRNSITKESSLIKHDSMFSMGVAPFKTAIFYYILLVFTKTASQGLSNLSMTQINYPAKTLFKSANPIITIFIGVFWFKKTYSIKDYIAVLLLFIGLFIFITGSHDDKNSAKSTYLGVMYAVLSLLGNSIIIIY
jgi:drug/metabolite transporter (DMT)-like permease